MPYYLSYLELDFLSAEGFLTDNVSKWITKQTTCAFFFSSLIRLQWSVDKGHILTLLSVLEYSCSVDVLSSLFWKDCLYTNLDNLRSGQQKQFRILLFLMKIMRLSAWLYYAMLTFSAQGNSLNSNNFQETWRHILTLVIYIIYIVYNYTHLYI